MTVFMMMSVRLLVLLPSASTMRVLSTLYDNKVRYVNVASNCLMVVERTRRTLPLKQAAAWRGQKGSCLALFAVSRARGAGCVEHTKSHRTAHGQATRCIRALLYTHDYTGGCAVYIGLIIIITM